MRAARFILALALAFYCARQPGAANPPASKTDEADRAAEGQALVRDLIAQKPPENTEIYGVLKIRRGDGQRAEVPVKYLVKIGDLAWEGIYETKPTPAQPAEKLTVIYTPRQPNRYWFAQAREPGGALDQPMAVTNANAALALAGSDFWVGDLGLEFLHWPEQRLVKKEMRKGRPCKVVESVNPTPAPGVYGRVRSWIDAETGGLIRAEAYGEDGKLLKEFSVRAFKKVEGQWQLKEMEIRNDKTDSRTRLEFDLELK